MAKTLEVPPSSIKGLEKILLDIDDETLDHIVKTLAEAEPTRKLDDYVATLVGAGIVSADDALSVIQLLGNVAHLNYMHQTPLEESVDQIADALKDASDRSAEAPPEKWERFKQFVSDLSAMESPTGLGAKAAEVTSFYPNTFVECQILTDPRPIFSNNDDGKVEGFAIMHSLHISYRTGHERTDFYVTLDEENLHALSSAIERAVLKESVLSSILEQHGRIVRVS